MEFPLTECNQLRQISLTNVIMRLFIFQEEIRHPSKLIIDKTSMLIRKTQTLV